MQAVYMPLTIPRLDLYASADVLNPPPPLFSHVSPLQGVDAAAIAVAKKDEKQNTLVVPEGPADGLHAAFNKEKQQLADEDNPHMYVFVSLF